MTIHLSMSPVLVASSTEAESARERVNAMKTFFREAGLGWESRKILCAAMRWTNGFSIEGPTTVSVLPS
jgi:hypothetical protein